MRIWQENSWYWELDGKPVLLLGGSDEDNLFNHPSLMRQNLETLSKCGGNYIRCTLSSRDKGNVQPYDLVDGRYDLYRFNREYWDRLDDCCRESARRGIVVQMEIWATYDFHGRPWLENPFNPSNNLNYTAANTSLVADWPHHPADKVQPFFRTVPQLDDDATVLAFQQAFVDKVLDTTLRFENALYCVDVETSAPAEWGIFWGEYINKEAARRGLPLNLTETWHGVDVRGSRHAGTYSRPDLFNYVDISRNNELHEREHWNSMMWLRRTLSASEGGPRPINNVKVFGFGPSGGLDAAASSERFWQNIFAGCASTRFRSSSDAWYGLGLNTNAQRIIAAARAFADVFDVFHAAPAEQLILELPGGGAYCMARPPEAYAVYLPEGGQTRLDLTASERAMELQWLDPRTARFLPSRPVRGRRPVTLVPPDLDREWVGILAASR